MDNLDKWRFYTKDLESPSLFIDWALYWTVSAALQRRVWIDGGAVGLLYPNLCVVAVAPPGIGKSTCARLAGHKILKTFTYTDPKVTVNGAPAITPTIAFSAENSSLPSLIRQMAQSTKSFVWNTPEKTRHLSHSSLAILLSEEMTSLFSRQNEGVSDFLNQTLDCQDYEYKMKTVSLSDTVKNPCVALFGCTTPGRLNSLLRVQILQNGFTARTIFLYAGEKRFRRNLREINAEQTQALKEVYDHINALTKCAGEVKFDQEAIEFFNTYYESGAMDKARVNQNTVLDDYYGRKKVHIIKLSLVLHFLNSFSSIVTVDSIRKAIDVLAFAELSMHQALGVSGRNPLHEISLQVVELIKQKGPMTRLQLYLHLGKDARENEFIEILRTLQETGRILPKLDPTDNKNKYYII